MSNNFRLILAFGSNQGDREHNFAIALRYLQNSDPSFGIIQQSNYLVTAPFQNSAYNTKNHETYLNFVCDVATSVHPFQFYHDIIVPIEDQLGHSRTEKWAPRMLDIDILFGALNNHTDFINCSPVIIDNQFFSLPHKSFLEPERIVIKNMVTNELNLNNECIECHFNQILCAKN